MELSVQKGAYSSNNNAHSRNMSAIGSENSQSTANGTEASRSSPPEYGVVSQRTITHNEAIRDNTEPTAQMSTASCNARRSGGCLECSTIGKQKPQKMMRLAFAVSTKLDSSH